MDDLFEQFLEDHKHLVNDYKKPAWTFRFEVTVHADTAEEAIRLGKIDCIYENGIVEARPL